MSGIVYALLETPITFIPTSIKNHITIYNNAVSNGMTWILFFWLVLHYIYYKRVDNYLQHKHYKDFVRKRLLDASWNVLFGAIGFCYSYTSLLVEEIPIFDHRYLFRRYGGAFDESTLFGLIVIISYTIHLCIWNNVQYGICSMSVSNFFLSNFLIATTFTNAIGLPFTFLTWLTFAKCGDELLKCIVCIMKGNVLHMLSKYLISVSLFALLISHGITIPFLIVMPCIKELIIRRNFTTFMVNLTLWMWLGAEFYNNTAYQLYRHTKYHKSRTHLDFNCLGSTLECALFLPRDDDAHFLNMIRQEIILRKLKCLRNTNLRNKHKMFQLMKTMVGNRISSVGCNKDGVFTQDLEKYTEDLVNIEKELVEIEEEFYSESPDELSELDDDLLTEYSPRDKESQEDMNNLFEDDD